MPRSGDGRTPRTASAERDLTRTIVAQIAAPLGVRPRELFDEGAS